DGESRIKKRMNLSLTSPSLVQLPFSPKQIPQISLSQPRDNLVNQSRLSIHLRKVTESFVRW
ncbi:3499_t:CDS:1, partial [Acaulospora colombiana]